MAHSSTHPDFTVVVDGGFDAAGTWVIQARLTLREGLSREAISRLRPLWASIVRQGVELERSRGKGLGAARFRLQMEQESPGRFRRTRARALQAPP